MQAPQLEELGSLANRYFGFSGLRPEQEKALALIMHFPRVLITLPTGAGKSLLYALTGLMGRGLTVVVSPLTALKREQSRKFQERGIPAAFLAFDQSAQDRSGVFDAIDVGKLKILFVSPERFVSRSFTRRLASAPLERVFIDEAHCVVSWGFDFRPEYREVGAALERLRVPSVIALTATASRSTRHQIKRVIAPAGELVEELLSPPLRPNVHLSSVRVKTESARHAWLASALSRLAAGEKMIVYVQRRADAERLAASLKGGGFRTVCYHAGLGAQSRKELELYISASREPLVIFATQAFGMGVDLPEVRQVVIHGFPSGIEELLQMAGRAGRAGQPATSTLLWLGSDPVKRTYGVRQSLPEPRVVGRLLSPVLSWLKSEDARKLSHDAGSSVGETVPAYAGYAVLTGQVFDRVCADTRAAVEGACSAAETDELRACTPHLLLQVLRLADAAVSVPAGQAVVLFASRKRQRLFDLDEEWGSSDSQRRRVLAALAGEVFDAEGGQSALAPFASVTDLYRLQRETRLSLSQLEKVMAHLKSQVDLFVTVLHARVPLVLVRNQYSMAEALLQAYDEHRAERLSGLAALTQFARTSTCRMRPVWLFLEGSPHKPCGQCENCTRQGEKLFRSREIC